MEFLYYLYFAKLLTKEELSKLLKRQWNIAHGNMHGSGEFSEIQLDHLDDLQNIRLFPIGAILKADSQMLDEVCNRASCSYEEIEEGYWAWARRRMEPISRYSIASRFGRAIYENQTEKKLVANFLVSADVRDNGQTIVRDGDSVVIPEGSSAFYCALAISERRTNVSLITSNDMFLREFRDNPCVGRGIRRLQFIGGEAEFDPATQRSEYGGFFGEECHRQFNSAIREQPGATIVLIPCSFLSATEGPYSHDNNSATTKLSIIRDALDAKVREVVIVADHTKQVPNGGIPVDGDWNGLVERNPGRITVVTCPPPAMREWLVREEGSRAVGSRTVLGNPDPNLNTKQNQEYDKQAKELCVLLSKDFRSRFHEAFTFAPNLVGSAQKVR